MQVVGICPDSAESFRSVPRAAPAAAVDQLEGQALSVSRRGPARKPPWHERGLPTRPEHRLTVDSLERDPARQAPSANVLGERARGRVADAGPQCQRAAPAARVHPAPDRARARRRRARRALRAHVPDCEAPDGHGSRAPSLRDRWAPRVAATAARRRRAGQDRSLPTPAPGRIGAGGDRALGAQPLHGAGQCKLRTAETLDEITPAAAPSVSNLHSSG